MKRVLVFIDYFEPGYRAGGPIHSLKNYIQMFYSQYDFYVVTRNHDLNNYIQYDYPTNEWLVKDNYRILYLNKSLIINIYRNIFNEIRPDIVYLNSFFSYKYSILPIYFLSKLNVNFLLAPRGELSTSAIKNKWVVKNIYVFIAKRLGFYNDIVFHASNNREHSEIIRIFSKNAIKVTPDSILKPTPFSKNKYQKKHKELKLCFISRISPIKNLQLCLDVIRSMTCDNHVIFLDIYGPIENKKYWNQIYQHMTVNTKYCGELLHSEILPTITKYDFLFLPTLSENFGHIIYESFSAGTPVIISNNTFWHTLIGFDKHSYFFDLNHIDLVREILVNALELTSEEYQILSKKAYKFAEDYFELQKNNLSIFEL